MATHCSYHVLYQKRKEFAKFGFDAEHMHSLSVQMNTVSKTYPVHVYRKKTQPRAGGGDAGSCPQPIFRVPQVPSTLDCHTGLPTPITPSYADEGIRAMWATQAAMRTHPATGTTGPGDIGAYHRYLTDQIGTIYESLPEPIMQKLYHYPVCIIH